MCVRIYRTALGRILRPWLLRGTAALALICCIGLAGAQVQLPEVLVRGAKPKPKPAAAARVRAAPAPAVRTTPAERLATQTAALNQGLNTIYAPTGTAPSTISHNTITALPQGENATVEKIVLRFPGVTQDSAPGGNFHVRNEHANVQTRINGIMLPDGVSGFGTFLDTALIQFSPRFSLTWKPFDSTTFHAGYARTFTPPEQVLAAPTNLALVQNTTQQPSVPFGGPVRAERADTYDVGVVQQVLPGLEVGVDAYYKKATNLIDDGQFGAAYVLTAFNYAQGENVGVELSAKYRQGSFQAYANLAWAQQKATNPVSNQFLFDNSTPLADLGGLTEFQYLQTHWVFTDHSQFWTGSAGFSYQFCGRPARTDEIFAWSTAAVTAPWGSWCGVRVSSDMIAGSGLRDGDANISTVAPYAQFNAGIAREFLLPDDPKPPGRQRHRRVRPAIRPAPGLFCGHLEEILRRGAAASGGFGDENNDKAVIASFFPALATTLNPVPEARSIQDDATQYGNHRRCGATERDFRYTTWRSAYRWSCER
jgi:TonB dependent receptor